MKGQLQPSRHLSEIRDVKLIRLVIIQDEDIAGELADAESLGCTEKFILQVDAGYDLLVPICVFPGNLCGLTLILNPRCAVIAELNQRIEILIRLLINGYR